MKMLAAAQQYANENVRCDMLMGYIRMKTRIRIEGNKYIGEGRSLHYAGDGQLTLDTGWEPTGCVLTIFQEPERKWWEFW